MKYIVLMDEDGNEEIFIFPRSVNHDCMADACKRIKDQMLPPWSRVGREPIAAGFINDGVCSGYSETLGLKSRGPIDSALVEG